MGLDIKLASTNRIHILTEEREENGKYRPLKTRFHTIEERNKVLQNLHKLRSFNIFNIRITEDLTKTERDLIKSWWKKANEKNIQSRDKSFQWKVRGSPRTGIYLKKVCDLKKNGA